MTHPMTLNERLVLVANVSDLMLAGSIHAYMPPKRETIAIVHEEKKAA